MLYCLKCTALECTPVYCLYQLCCLCAAQGDKEAAANLPVSPLMDRKKEGVAVSQKGFFSIVVMPQFQVGGSWGEGGRRSCEEGEGGRTERRRAVAASQKVFSSMW